MQLNDQKLVKKAWIDYVVTKRDLVRFGYTVFALTVGAFVALQFFDVPRVWVLHALYIMVGAFFYTFMNHLTAKDAYEIASAM